MTFQFNTCLRQTISDNLTRFDVERNDDAGLRRAAVAIVVVPHPRTSDPSILLTLRPARMNRHSGQFALPGGRLDEGETIDQAALRELSEELRVDLAPDAIIGRLDDYPTRSGFRISPIVVWGEDTSQVEPDPNEVAEVYMIPLDQLNDPDILHLSPHNSDGRQVLSVLLPALGDFMYAPTAAMLYQFREVALNGRPTRVAHYDQPQFAWK